MKRKEWDSEEVESHFIGNNEDNGFQILKTSREHVHFWLFLVEGSWKVWMSLQINLSQC